MEWLVIDDKIRSWLKEDMNNGDLTTEALIDDSMFSSGVFIAREAGIVAGLQAMCRVFHVLDEDITVDCRVNDGDTVKADDILAIISGQTKNILRGERLALNILQRMSGIATQTAKFAAAVVDLPVRITDTRKTTPGMRMLEKYAVRIGGAHNHRFNLSDGVLIKDNHIAACGSIATAVARAKDSVTHTVKIEVEVENLVQLQEAITAGADIIMLDNMSVEMMTEAVKLTAGRTMLEASGNVSLARVREIAETGVDLVSVGALTHSVKAMDISLRFKVI